MAFGRAVRAWFAQEPQAALDYVRRRAKRSEYAAALAIVLDEIGKTEPELALQLAREMDVAHRPATIYSILFAHLASADPARAVRDLELVPAEGRADALRALASTWAEADPAAALWWAQTLGGADDERAVTIEAVAVILTKRNSVKAMNLAHQFLTGVAKERVLTASLHQLSTVDPEAAGALVRELPVEETQTAAALDVARALAARQPASALAWVDTLPAGDLHRAALNNVLDVWSRDQPDASAAYVAQMPPGADRNLAAAHLSADLAATDPTGTIAWVDTLGDPAARDGALVSAASGWARHDAASAAHWAASLDDVSDVTRQNALNGALSYWVLSDPAATAAFVPTLRDVDQPKALLAVVPALAQNDPAAALGWALSLPNEDIRALAEDGVIARWSDNDPAAAASWVQAEAASPLQIDHVRTVEQQWLNRDERSALGWGQTLPPGAARDAALDVAAEYFGPRQPTLAASLANSIASSALRTARIGALAQLSTPQRP